MSYVSPYKLLVIAVLLFPMSVLAQSGGGGGADRPEARRRAGPRPAERRDQRPALLPVQVRQERARRRLAALPDRAMSGDLTTPAMIRAVQAMPQRLPTRPALIRPGQQMLRDQRPPLGTALHWDRQRSEQRENPAGGATGGRIDGTVTQGPAMQGDDTIRAESSPDSKVDKTVKSICTGC
jgi:hypothetical protein